MTGGRGWRDTGGLQERERDGGGRKEDKKRKDVSVCCHTRVTNFVSLLKTDVFLLRPLT